MKYVICLIVSICLFACNTSKSNIVTVYIGSVNQESGKGIEVCKFDTLTGEISSSKLVAELANPNYINLDKSGEILFAVGKSKKDQFTINSFKVLDNDSLELLSSVSSLGKDPCFVEYIDNKEMLLVANYSSGNISYFIVKDGIIQKGKRLNHHGNGPNLKRQRNPHAHSIRYDPNTGFVYAADLGADKIMIYNIEGYDLVVHDSIISTSGAGPRHLDFHPKLPIMSVVNELNCSVTNYAHNSDGIAKVELNTLSLIDDSVTGFAKAADIHFSPDGNYLYASNRGFNAIGIYSLNEENIELIGFQTEGINWPRNFTTQHCGDFLLVANRDSNEINVFKRNKETGLLSETIQRVSTMKPVCIKIKK